MSGDMRAGARRLALVRVGRFHLAIDSHLVESVVPGPLPLSPFPCAAPHVLGAFASRTGPMPTIDLAALLDGRDAATSRDVVDLAAVLRLDAGRFALAIDVVGGVVPVASGQLSTIERYSAEGAGLFTEVFAPADGAPPAVVLDIAAVLRIGDLHTAVQAADATGTESDTAADSLSLVLLRAGEIVFALDAHVVAHVERRTAADDFALQHPSLRGFHLRKGRHLPVVELLATLDLPPSSRVDAGSHLVIVDDGHSAGTAIIVDSIVAVSRVSRAAIQPLSDEAPASGPLVSGCVHDATHGVVVLLAVGALLSATMVVDGGAAQVAASESGDHGVERHYMVYRAGGGLLASLLADVAAVAQLPADFVDLRRDGSPTVGVFSRHGRAVQVLDLGVLMGAAALGTVVDQPLLIVETAAGTQGFLVASVSFLRSAVPTRIPSPGRRQVGVMPRLSEMIAIASDGADRSATVLDLRELAERTARATGAAATDVAA